MSKINNKQDSILFVDSSISIDDIIKLKNSFSNIQIFSFDYVSHKLLIKNNISHKISDTFLSENNLDLIQQKSYQFAEWYKIPKINNYQNFENIDLGSLFKIEFFVFLLPFLKKIFEIRNILNSYDDSVIYSPNSLFSICFKFNKNTKLINENQKNQNNFHYDVKKFETNFINIEISQKTYKKLKNFMNNFSNLFFKFKTNNPHILLVEFNTILYKELFFAIKKFSLNSVFYGLRRPPIWNLNSFSIFCNSKCKIASSTIEQNNSNVDENVCLMNENFSKIIEYHDEDLENFFTLNDFSFWSILKPFLIKLFQKYVFESVENIIISKKMLTEVRPNHILLLSESGSTEQIILKLSKQFGIDSSIFQHGLGHDTEKGHIYNKFTGTIVNDSDHYFIWGDAQYRYAKKYNLSLKKIIKIGSIVHDQTFKILNRNPNKNFNPDLILLATQGPLHMNVRDYTVQANIEYDNIIRTICKISKQNNKKLIIKLHPYEDDNGESKIAKEIDPTIQVIKNADILPLIDSSNFMISLGTSLSNVILDAHILKKPVIRIPFGEWNGSPDQLRESSCFNLPVEDFDTILQKLFTNKKFKTKLIDQGQKFVNDCLENKGISAENIVKYFKKI
jgi:hypothetical protein